MLSELLIITSLLATVPTNVDAHAEPATASDTAEKPEPESGPVCSADSRRARRAAAARELRLHREALKVTRETLADATQILAARSDGVVERWQAEFRSNARERLESTRDRSRSMLRLPTPELCAALSTRDAASCASLADPDERGPCKVWTAVAGRAKQGDSGCTRLPEPAKSICVLTTTGEPKSCEAAPAPHRGFCHSAAQSLSGGQAGCAAPFQSQRCTWALLIAALGDAAPPCQSEAGDGPELRRAIAFCKAAIEGKESQCPTDARPEWATAEGTRSLHHEDAFRVEEGTNGPMGWVALMTSAPAACAVSLSADDGAETSFGAAILSTLDDVLIGVGPLAPSEKTRALKTICVPTFDWRTGSKS